MRMVIYAAIDKACGLLQSHGLRWPLRTPSSASSCVAAAQHANGAGSKGPAGQALIPRAAGASSSNLSSSNTPGSMIPPKGGLPPGARPGIKQLAALPLAPALPSKAIPPPTPHVQRLPPTPHLPGHGAPPLPLPHQQTYQQHSQASAPLKAQQLHPSSPQGAQQQLRSLPEQRQQQQQPGSAQPQQPPPPPQQQQPGAPPAPAVQHNGNGRAAGQQQMQAAASAAERPAPGPPNGQSPAPVPKPFAAPRAAAATPKRSAKVASAGTAAAEPAPAANADVTTPPAPPAPAEAPAPVKPPRSRRPSGTRPSSTRKSSSQESLGSVDGPVTKPKAASKRASPASSDAATNGAPANGSPAAKASSTTGKSARGSSSAPSSRTSSRSSSPSGTSSSIASSSIASSSIASSSIDSTSSVSTPSVDSIPGTASRGRAKSSTSSAPKPTRKRAAPPLAAAKVMPAAPAAESAVLPAAATPPPAALPEASKALQSGALEEQPHAPPAPAPQSVTGQAPLPQAAPQQHPAPQQTGLQQARPPQVPPPHVAPQQLPIQHTTMSHQQGPPDNNPASQLSGQQNAWVAAAAQHKASTNGTYLYGPPAPQYNAIPPLPQPYFSNSRQPSRPSTTSNSGISAASSHIMGSNMPFNAKVEALHRALKHGEAGAGVVPMQPVQSLLSPQQQQQQQQHCGSATGEQQQRQSIGEAFDGWKQMFNADNSMPATAGRSTLPPRRRPSSSSSSPNSLLAAAGSEAISAAAAGQESEPVAPLSAPPPDVCIVDSIERAQAVAARALELAERGVVLPDGTREDAIFACDTEVAGIDIKEESPVGHGSVICFSFYCGPWANFNPDPAGPVQARVWVDLMPFAQQQAQQLEQQHAQACDAAQAAYTAARERQEAARQVLVTAKQQLDEAVQRQNEQLQQQQEDQQQGQQQEQQEGEASPSQPSSPEPVTAGERRAAARAKRLARAKGGAAATGKPAASRRKAAALPRLPEHDALDAADQAFKDAAAAAAAAAAELERLHSMPTAPKVAAPSVQDILNHPEAAGILAAFQPFFESDKVQKVWHNYGFDRHVLANMGVSLGGFAGDTMHMARLHDASRKLAGGYSLESLSSDRLLMRSIESELGDAAALPKRGMKERFGRRKEKRDRTLGKVITIAPMHLLQTDEEFRWEWVDYSALDAKATWNLHRALKKALLRSLAFVEKGLDTTLRAGLKEQYGNNHAYCGQDEQYTMWRVYEQYWRPFGKLLSDMEAEGVMVNRKHLEAAEQQAKQDQEASMAFFRAWAESRVPEARYMNIGSGLQIRQLLFPDAVDGGVRTFKVLNPDYERGIAEDWKPKPRRHIEFELHGVWGRGQKGRLDAVVMTDKGSPAVSTAVLRSLAGKPGAARKALAALDDAPPAQHPVPILEEDDEVLFAANAAAAADEDSPDADGMALSTFEEGEDSDGNVSNAMSKRIEELEAEAAAKGYGKMYGAMGGGREGLHACAAVEALCEVSAIDKLLSAFIVPLQGDDISTPDHRVHCSLNLNTETGRLSARRPNLQNQPALEKDRYKVRKAFTADVAAGKTLVVADYGQLELRLLAHMANCKSMLTAFELGGDFHSRTALGMYDHIQEAIAKEECLLEWGGEGPSPVPLLKDKFGSERRKAKVLNFSIAYGKTARGLSKDWGVSLQEAEETVERWYADRPEVLKWQQDTRAYAAKHGWVNTMLGRRRNLPGINSSDRFIKLRAERAAINTPIQGSAADVASAAMLAIAEDEWLKENGWKLLLQVHDEVMLEGPKESAEEARQRVIAAMANPWDNLLSFKGKPLLVDLVVDCNIADTWYEAK